MKRLEVVVHGAGQDSPQRPVVAVIGSLQGGKVGRPLLFEHDDWRIAEPHQEQVQQQAAGTAVPVDEGVDLLEAVVQPGEDLGGRNAAFAVDFARGGGTWSIQSCTRAGTSGQDGGVIPAPNERMSCSRNMPGPSPVSRVRVRRDLPDRAHCERMDLADLVHRDKSFSTPVPGSIAWA
jgi:hypothetical protein